MGEKGRSDWVRRDRVRGSEGPQFFFGGRGRGYSDWVRRVRGTLIGRKFILLLGFIDHVRRNTVIGWWGE